MQVVINKCFLLNHEKNWHRSINRVIKTGNFFSLGTTNRPVTTRPVQAVAPQPRNPQVSEKAEATETHRSTLEEKISSTPNLSNPAPEPPPQPENPKICLKIK